MRGSSPALAILAPRPRIVPRPGPRSLIPKPPDAEPEPRAPEALPDERAVLAYLATLTPAERLALLDRVEAPFVPPAPPSDAEPFDLTPRPTLRSIDLEIVLDTRRPSPASVPPPLPSRARLPRRLLETPPLSHPELIDEIASSLADLPFFQTVVEAASFCLVTAMRVLPSLAGLALVRDEVRGGYVVVYAKGPRAFEVVRTRVPEDDPAIGKALVHGGPVAIEYGSGITPAERHAVFGDPWTVLVAPVEDPQRCLATLELVDPIDGRALGDSARHVLATIARHLATFARERPRDIGNVFAPEQLGLED